MECNSSTTGHQPISWIISDKLGDIGVPVSRIITLLKSCGKLLLAQAAIKGKSLKEVVALRC